MQVLRLSFEKRIARASNTLIRFKSPIQTRIKFLFRNKILDNKKANALFDDAMWEYALASKTC